MKALKIVGAVIGSLFLCVVLFVLASVFIFWREPDPRETCTNIARLSDSPKIASSELGMKACVQTMSGKAYGFGNKQRLASYRRCLHDASSSVELKACESEKR